MVHSRCDFVGNMASMQGLSDRGRGLYPGLPDVLTTRRMTWGLMEIDTYLRLFLSLAVVLGLIFGTAALLRKYGSGLMSARGVRSATKRLSVQEVLQLDPRRRVVLIRQDDREHLVMLGGAQDLVIAADLPVPRFRLPDEAARDEPRADWTPPGKGTSDRASRDPNPDFGPAPDVETRE